MKRDVPEVRFIRPKMLNVLLSKLLQDERNLAYTGGAYGSTNGHLERD